MRPSLRLMIHCPFTKPAIDVERSTFLASSGMATANASLVSNLLHHRPPRMPTPIKRLSILGIQLVILPIRLVARTMRTRTTRYYAPTIAVLAPTPRTTPIHLMTGMHPLPLARAPIASALDVPTCTKDLGILQNQPSM